MGDLAEFQACVLGLSSEYQALGRWYVLQVVLIFVFRLPPTVLISIPTFALISLLALPVFWLLWPPLPLSLFLLQLQLLLSLLLWLLSLPLQ